MFSTKKREKEEGSFKGLVTGYDIFIFLFIASMLCFAVRRTLDGTYEKNTVTKKSYQYNTYVCTLFLFSTEQPHFLIANADASCPQKRK